MSTIENRSPFKFLDSYTEADRDIFFGRDAEVEEVYAKVFQSKILLIYGASGTGKSSIVNCGLANKFMSSDWLQIPVRRGGNILSSLSQQVNKFNLSSPHSNPEEHTSPKELKASLSSVFLDHFKPIYLVFDQFEELFIFGSKEEWISFTEVMRQLLESDLELRFIFVIRGEYLEFLAEFEEMIPGFFDNRVRIEKMTRSRARETILGPCNEAGIVVEDGVADELLDKLSPGGSRVELTFLQVFLDKLYKQALERTPEGEQVRFTHAEVERLGQMSDVLAEFVDEQLFRMENTRLATAILKSFVSLQGTKVPLTMDEVLQSLGKREVKSDEEEVSEILQSLVNRRILKDQDDEGRFELRHDSLAQKIFEKIGLQERERLEVEQFLNLSLTEFRKRGAYLSEEDLVYIAPHERKLNLSKEMQEFIALSSKRSRKRRRQRRNRGILAVVIIMLSIASVIGFINSQQQKQRADELAAEALQKSEEALEQKDLAEAERQNALANKEEAEQQAALALKASELADAQREVAQQERNRAELEKQAAEKARIQSEKNRLEAERLSQLAQTEKEKAEHLRLLGLSRELAISSARLTNPGLKTQLALISYYLNRQEDAYAYQSEIHEALRDAVWFEEGVDYFKVTDQPGTINTILAAGDQSFAVTDQGALLRFGSSKQTDVLLEATGKPWHFLKYQSASQLIFVGNKAGDLMIFDLNSSRALWSLEDFNADLKAIAFSPSGDELLVLSKQSLQVLDKNGALLSELALDGQPVAMAVSNASDQVWLLDRTGEVLVYKSGTVSHWLDLPGGVYTKIAVNNAGTYLAMGTEKGMIYLADIRSGGNIEELPGHRAAISDLHFSNNSPVLVSGGFDRSARVWHLDHLEKAPVNIHSLPNWVSSASIDDQDRIWLAVYGGTAFRYEADPADLFEHLCQVPSEPLTAEQWQEYVATDIDQFNPCDD